MKRVIVFLSLFIVLKSNAQQGESNVEQYCEVVATGRLLSNRVTIDIDYGEQRSIWRDNRLKDDDGKLKKFNTVIDALNHLGKDGWKLVNAFPVANGNGPMIYHYVFKKEFTKTEAGQ